MLSSQLSSALRPLRLAGVACKRLQADGSTGLELEQLGVGGSDEKDGSVGITGVEIEERPPSAEDGARVLHTSSNNCSARVLWPAGSMVKPCWSWKAAPSGSPVDAVATWRMTFRMIGPTILVNLRQWKMTADVESFLCLLLL